jgi:alkanesulfonate monooxygenase SsuD/methylene tetrahydromethanopterin reductase-like flavin-dependent oxidoreductase (luciferase family)
MKFHWFHLMPYPELPDEFGAGKKYHSSAVDVPIELFDPTIGHRAYNDYLDELEYAADMGFDGICVNEHHQQAYGLMPSPNIMAASLARRTSKTALVVLGNSIALYNPPTRVAEEFAMLDVISGGRLVAGFPVGTVMDTAYAYGATPETLRDKYREAHDLIVKAWTEDEPFAWNGKYTQLRYVNTWPRPIQKPHPPIWVPGGGSIETWEWIIEQDYFFAYLSYAGYLSAERVLTGYWENVKAAGRDQNPYRAGFLQFVGVADTEREAEELYEEPMQYFFDRCLNIDRGFTDAPGYRSLRSIQAGLRSAAAGRSSMFGGPRNWKQYVDDGTLISGSVEQVTEKMRELIKKLRIGHLMMLQQFGNLSKEGTMMNTRLFAEKVMPELKDLWDDEWEDRWWIQPLAEEKTAQPAEVVG